MGPKPGQCPFLLPKKYTRNAVNPVEGSPPGLPFHKRGNKNLSSHWPVKQKYAEFRKKEAGISFPAQQIMSTLSHKD